MEFDAGASSVGLPAEINIVYMRRQEPFEFLWCFDMCSGRSGNRLFKCRSVRTWVHRNIFIHLCPSLLKPLMTLPFFLCASFSCCSAMESNACFFRTSNSGASDGFSFEINLRCVIGQSSPGEGCAVTVEPGRDPVKLAMSFSRSASVISSAKT